jgi:hypothetical protein
MATEMTVVSVVMYTDLHCGKLPSMTRLFAWLDEEYFGLFVASYAVPCDAKPAHRRPACFAE